MKYKSMTLDDLEGRYVLLQLNRGR